MKYTLHISNKFIGDLEDTYNYVGWSGGFYLKTKSGTLPPRQIRCPVLLLQ